MCDLVSVWCLKDNTNLSSVEGGVIDRAGTYRSGSARVELTPLTAGLKIVVGVDFAVRPLLVDFLVKRRFTR